jgi:hypothetical protein
VNSVAQNNIESRDLMCSPSKRSILFRPLPVSNRRAHPRRLAPSARDDATISMNDVLKALVPFYIPLGIALTRSPMNAKAKPAAAHDFVATRAAFLLAALMAGS